MNPTNLSNRFVALMWADKLLSEEGFNIEKFDLHGIVDLMGKVSDYREEGEEMFPEIVITDDERLLTYFPSYSVPLGEFERTREQYVWLLKLFAPLSNSGWVLFLQIRSESRIYCSVANSKMSETSISVYDQTVGDASIDKPGSSVLYLRRLRKNLIEITGKTGQHTFHSAIGENVAVLGSEVRDLCSIMVSDCKEETRLDLLRFLEKVIEGALLSGHGNLIAILEDSDESLDKFAKLKTKAEVSLPKPIDLEEIFWDAKHSNALDAHTKLGEFAILVRSMLNHDGVCVLTSKARILAYHLLVEDNLKEDEGIHGGARLKAFKSLRNCGVFEGCFYKSQDGNSKLWLAKK